MNIVTKQNNQPSFKVTPNYPTVFVLNWLDRNEYAHEAIVEHLHWKPRTNDVRLGELIKSLVMKLEEIDPADKTLSNCMVLYSLQYVCWDYVAKNFRKSIAID